MPAFRLSSPVSLRIVASATAFPGPIRDPRGVEHDEVDNAAIFENAMGPDWRAKLEASGQDPDYAEKAVGLKKRRWTHWVGTPIDHDETHTGDLAVEAARKAMEKAGVGPEGIDLVILSTTSPLKVTSSTATHVAGRLDIEAPAIELKAGCSSGHYALITAASYLRLGARRILLVASETLSKFATPGVPQAMLNVGDGAGALIVEDGGKTDAALLSAMFSSDGKLGEIVSTPGLLPPTVEAVQEGRYFYAGDPKELKDAVAEKYPLVFKSIFTDAAMFPTSLDLYIPHQVNRMVTEQTSQGLGLPPEKVFVNLHEHGNLGSACFFVALHEAMEAGRVKRGQTVGTAVVGGGLTWAGAILRL